MCVVLCRQTEWCGASTLAGKTHDEAHPGRYTYKRTNAHTHTHTQSVGAIAVKITFSLFHSIYFGWHKSSVHRIYSTANRKKIRHIRRSAREETCTKTTYPWQYVPHWTEGRGWCSVFIIFFLFQPSSSLLNHIAITGFLPIASIQPNSVKHKNNSIEDKIKKKKTMLYNTFFSLHLHTYTYTPMYKVSVAIVRSKNKKQSPAGGGM